MNSVSLEQLEKERGKLDKARNAIKDNLVAHEGAIQLIDQLILMAKNDKQTEEAPAEA